jgi:Holliday junction DNA helicase RuvB
LENDRLIDSDEISEDFQTEISLRPRNFSEYVGQERIKQTLSIAIRAAQKRVESLDHVLLYGPPGLGKTTLANVISHEMKTDIKVTSGPAIEKAGDLVAILTRLQKGDILFIDEIHRLNKVSEEVLYSAMEEYRVSWVIEQGLKARSVNLGIQPFTLIGATTKYGKLSPPLRDRFGSIFRLNFYTDPEMTTILKRSSNIFKVKTEQEGLEQIAKRSRKTPRIGNRLLRRVRDFSEIESNGIINLDVVINALDQLEVDSIGLDKIDIDFLNSLIVKFGGGPVGLDTLSASINEDTGTVEDVIEPFLLNLGFISRTNRGRIATNLAYEHLGIEIDPKQGNLI